MERYNIGRDRNIYSNGPYFPKVTIQPDIVGYKKEEYSEKVLCVEVETSAQTIYQGIGQCAVYQTMSDYVYLALPKHVCDAIQSPRMFKTMRIGLLELTKREPLRKEMSPVAVNLKFEPEESYRKESIFHQQLLNMLRDFSESNKKERRWKGRSSDDFKN